MTKYSAIGRLAALAFIPCLAMFIAAPSHASKMNQQAKLSRINQSIARQRSEVRENTAREFNLEQELKELDKKLADEQKKLQTTQQKLTRQNDDLQRQIQNATAIIKQKKSLETHIQKRLAAFYKTGDLTIINTLFAARSMSDFLNLQEYFQSMFHYDQQLIKHYRTQLILVTEAQQAIRHNKARFLEIINQEKTQEKQLINSRLARNRLLEQIKTQKKLYQQALVEMEINAANLKKLIGKLEIPVIRARHLKSYKKKLHRARPAAPVSGFAARQGRLPKPVIGRIIRYFGVQTGDYGIKTESTGLDFETGEKADIRAVYDGKIIFSDNLTGYGKMLIIDHGQQYYSVTANVGEFLKMKGDNVKAGDIIARTNTSGGLHFEIRHRSRTLDPLVWLDKSNLRQDKQNRTRPANN